ncbi:MAG TPA: hypothetical protein VGU20_01170 [Stellaceae bacterium]|nr:hypothetical protein [Stellaceae bacterium]
MTVTTLERQAEAIDRFKADKGIKGRDYVPVNSGVRRTQAKRQLLSAMSKAAAVRGVEPRFRAKF